MKVLLLSEKSLKIWCESHSRKSQQCNNGVSLSRTLLIFLFFNPLGIIFPYKLKCLCWEKSWEMSHFNIRFESFCLWWVVTYGICLVYAHQKKVYITFSNTYSNICHGTSLKKPSGNVGTRTSVAGISSQQTCFIL